jgi:hypothetical protein
MKSYPQVQWNHPANPTTFARVVRTTDDYEKVSNIRSRLDFRLWQSMASKDWIKWENLINMYRTESFGLDEVSFTITLHGYLMSHYHPSSMAYLVLDEMRAKNIHPAIVELNEELIKSFFELEEIGIKSSLNGWQNIARLAWMSAARLRKKRAKRVRELLESIPTSEILHLSENDVKGLIDAEHDIARMLVDTDDYSLLQH